MITPDDEKKDISFVAKLTSDPPKFLLTPFESTVVDDVNDEIGCIHEGAWSSIDEDLSFPKDKVFKGKLQSWLRALREERREAVLVPPSSHIFSLLVIAPACLL